MTLTVRAARATDVYQFAYFDTPAAPPHVVEVEQWIRQHAWAWVRTPAEADDHHLLVGDLNSEIVAVGAHALVEPSVRYVMAISVQHEYRGRGIGREFVAAVFAQARQVTPAAAIFGLIAPDNEAMIGLAESLGGSAGGDQDGYRVYRSPHSTE